MNKTKIEWTDMTFNPETGCLHGCWYCYAKKIFTRFHKSFEPTFYPERLGEIGELKQPTERNNRGRKPWIVKAFPKNWLIFVCSVADLFAEWSKPEWTKQILDTMAKHPQHIYQLLTKQPQGIPQNSNFGDNVIVGVTITNDAEMDKLYTLVNCYKGRKFISFEPLLGSVKIMQTDSYFDKIDWVIIGQLTGNKKVPIDKEVVRYIIRESRARQIPVFIKSNVGWEEKIQEFPVAGILEENL